MFKKDPGLKALSNLKSSERRRMLASICETYKIPQDRITHETEQNLVPSVVKQATFKSPLGFSGTIYTDGQQTPIWFKTKDSTLIPTVFTLWKCPFTLPIVHTHPHVIKIISNGADLMLPGTVPPFDPKCVKGAVVGVADSANPTVVKAIGYCKFDLSQFDSVIGRTGVAVEIVHGIDDCLYKMCDIEIIIPVVLSLDTPMKELEQEEDTATDDKETLSQGNESDEVATVVYATSIEDGTNESTPQQDGDVNELAETAFQLSIQDIDHFFRKALLQTLFLDTVETPISSSNFMANHILKNLPSVDSSSLAIKKSSWKKSAKFLKAMEKAGFLKVKGKGDDLIVTAVSGKEMEEIKTFVPHKVKKVSSSSEASSSKKDKLSELTVLNLYKPTSKSRMFFNKIDETFDHLYTGAELNEFLKQYIKIQDLVHPKNPKNILLDDNLLSITGEKVSYIGRDKIFTSFLKNFSPNYMILKPNDDPKNENIHVFKGVPPKIQIISEMRLGRKIITRVSNFEQFYIKPQSLSDELKVKCSGSSTIGACTHNPKLTEVTVQGPHGKLIIDLLQKKGVPASFILFEDKVKPKKKKVNTTPAVSTN